jgi:thioredoxin-like negative regulator of GroEL
MKLDNTQLLKFYTDWCNPCSTLTKFIDQVSLPMEVIPVNLEENLDFALKYKVRNVPTLILIDEDGNPLEIANGLEKAKEMLFKVKA